MGTRTTSAALQFASVLSTEADSARAIDEVCRLAAAELPTPPDLAMAFVSAHHASQMADLARAVCERLGAKTLLGCTGESIVAGGREIEGEPAISLWLGSLPGVTLQPMRLEFEQTEEGGVFSGWPSDLPDEWPENSALLLLADPFTFPADRLLERLNQDRPGTPILGGMASGGWQPGENRLLLGPQSLEGGAVAVLLHGPVRVRTVVSQGCRPIGRTFVITKAERNIIFELSGLPAIKRLEEIYGDLTPAEQQLVRSGLHVGRVLNEYQEKFDRGDFLIRNVIGADSKTGALAIGDFVRVGQTVQFHIRDAETADEDLQTLLSHGGGRPTPAGALLFTCNGRGQRLFSQPNHDAGCVQQAFGNIPLAGFFAQGEIGPIGRKNFLHGFTASLALFESPPEAP